MPLVRITLIFSGPDHGWSEGWYIDTVEDNYDAIFGLVAPVVQLRGALLGNLARVKAIRISNAELPGRVGNSYAVNYAGPGITKGLTGPADALICHVANQNAQQVKNTFLRGAWNEVIAEGPVYSPTAAWLTAFNLWRSAVLAAQWGWRNSIISAPATITSYVKAANQVVTFQLSGNLFVGLPVGTRTSVRISRLNGRSTLNGMRKVIVLSDNSCKTAKPIGCGSFETEGQMYSYTYAFTRAYSLGIFRVGRRAQGAPLLASVGRSGVRPLV